MKRRRSLSKGRVAAALIAVFAAVFAVFVVVLNLFIPVRYMTAYLVRAQKSEEGVMTVSFLDVDFGDCALVILPDGENMLIDGGDGSYTNTLTLLKTLNSAGIDEIDYLVCTSVKDEHCGGFAELLKYKTVRKVYIPYCNNKRITEEYLAFCNAVTEQGVETEIACVGTGVEGDDWFFCFLSPAYYESPLSEYTVLNDEANTENIENASAVLWLEYGETSFAFTSDARPDALKRMVEEYEFCAELGQVYCKTGDSEVKLDECDVMTAPCHAGEKNTYAPWYDLTKPEKVVVSVGENFAGYPSTIALSDVCSCDRNPLYTSDGTITFTVTKDGYTYAQK